MFGSGILDLAIGLTFVFLLVSMVVTIANELIAAALLSRAKWLRYGIDRLIGSEWATQLYQHPLIYGSTKDGSATDACRASSRGPSYIPSRSFANVLMALLHNRAAGLKEIEHELQVSLNAALNAGATIDTMKRHMAAAAVTLRPSLGLKAKVGVDLTRLLDAVPAGGDEPANWLNDLQGAATAIANSSEPQLKPIADILHTLVTEATTAQLDARTLRPRLQAAINEIPYLPIAAAIRADLNALYGRLQQQYTVADAQADIQRFIDAMPMRYVRHVIDELPDERMRKTLLALLDDAANDVENFKENIETWFNNAMDRVNGWYKRRTQWVIISLAVVAAVGLNIDTVLLVRHLQTNPATMAALADQAKAFSEQSQNTEGFGASNAGAGTVSAQASVNAGDTYQGTLQLDVPATSGTVTLSSNIPSIEVHPASIEVKQKLDIVPFTATTPVSDQPVTAIIKASGNATGAVQLNVRPSLPAQFRAVQAQIRDLSLPIGWFWNPSQAQLKNGQAFPRSFSEFGERLLEHSLGWLITALAATLGAPFWFDTLNRIIAIRSTGRAPEEKPKPPKEAPVPLEPISLYTSLPAQSHDGKIR